MLFNPELYFLSQLPAEMNPARRISVVIMALGAVLHRHDLPGMARLASSIPSQALRYE